MNNFEFWLICWLVNLVNQTNCIELTDEYTKPDQICFNFGSHKLHLTYVAICILPYDLTLRRGLKNFLMRLACELKKNTQLER